MEEFDNLLEFLRLDRVYSNWSAKLTLKDRIKELKEEIQELEDAIENNDLENLHEELVDVLFNSLALMVIAEDMHGCNPKIAIKNMFNKINERKPNVLLRKHISHEEEGRVYKEVKAKQKARLSLKYHVR